MRVCRYFFSLLAIACSAHVFCADNAVGRFVSSSITKNATISLLVKNVETGRVVADFRSNSATPPASITKLLTTATAMEMLGPDFRFETYLETDGMLENGVLHGNLYIRGTGDPTLGSYKVGNRNFLSVWVREIRDAGIKQIKGGVVADISFFDTDEAINPQWIWEDIGNYYAPGISALSYMDNSMNIQLMSGAVGSIATVIKTLPTVPDVEFENHIVCKAIDYDGAYVHGLPFSNRRYLVGSVPANKGVFGLRGDIPNPGLLLAQHLTSQLESAGINVSKPAGYQKEKSQEEERKVIYVHKSPLLSEIIIETNFQSNNHYAEQLFRYLGSRVAVPATVKNSVDIIKQFWKARMIDLSSVFLCDGSGLAPQNAIPADVFVDLLTYMSQVSKYKDTFISTLPVAGETGTLSGFLKDTSLHGKVQAKSGTTSRIKSYAGYMNIPGKGNFVFCVIVNNGAAKARVVQREIEHFLVDLTSELPTQTL